MLHRELGPATVMGFARYKAMEGVEPADLIAAARRWQKEFLGSQPGIAMHCFLGNLKGDYADAILATDEKAFAAMGEAHMKAPSSLKFMDMLETDTIRLCRNLLLKGAETLPTGFSAIEFGTFKPRSDNKFSEQELMAASDRIETEYLSRFPESRAHFMGRVDDTTYSEISFVQSSGAAREICAGYLDSEACQPLLNLFDPQSVDLDFWHVLA